MGHAQKKAKIFQNDRDEKINDQIKRRKSEKQNNERNTGHYIYIKKVVNKTKQHIRVLMTSMCQVFRCDSRSAQIKITNK